MRSSSAFSRLAASSAVNALRQTLKASGVRGVPRVLAASALEMVSFLIS